MKRIACGPKGVAEMKAHPWFKKIDWTVMLHKMVDPPFKPTIKSDEDTTHIDEEFLREAPRESVPVNSDFLQSNQDVFDGFTY